MKLTRLVLPLTLALLASTAFAQAPSVPAPWDLSASVEKLARQAASIVPLLDALSPEEWVRKGASPTYVLQWQNTRAQLGYLADSAHKLERQPEKLPAALDTLFRLLNVETNVRSLAEGARAYDRPSAGDALLAAVGETSTDRDSLQQYILDLAGQREQEFSVIDREAQRCRTTVNRLPVPAVKSRPATAK